LEHLRELIVREKIWTALPGEVDQWWRARGQMKLVQNGSQWEIEGADNRRARIAYATIDNGRLVYELSSSLIQQGVLP
jgi:hypothetical protein